MGFLAPVGKFVGKFGAELIGAGGLVGGAALQSRASGKAVDAQTEATNEALAYEKEREAQRRADWEQAMAQYTANRNALLSRYGVSVPQAQGYAGSYSPYSGPSAPGAVPRGADPMGPIPGAQIQGGAPLPTGVRPMPVGAMPQGMPPQGMPPQGRPARATRPIPAHASRGANLSLGELAMRSAPRRRLG